MEIEQHKEMPRSKKMVTSVRVRNPRKYYKYHRDHEHDTEKCWQLKNDIEALIRQGRLRRYVDKQRISSNPQRKQPKQEDPHREQPTACEIRMIAGGHLGGDASEHSWPSVEGPKKRKIDDEITFTVDDLQGIS